MEKQNQPMQMGMARRSRNKKGNAITSEGNDFVLKRYKLEENQTFKEAGHEDINYSLQPKGRAKEVEVEEQGLEEDLVIVPFNLQDNEEDQLEEELEEALEEAEREGPAAIYMFDDEEEEDIVYQEAEVVVEEKEEDDVKQSKCFDLLEPCLPMKRESIQEVKNNIQKIDESMLFGPEFHYKSTERSNYSTTELMTPSLIQQKGIFGPSFIKKEEVQADKEDSEQNQQIQKIKGVELQEGTDDNVINIVDKKTFSLSKLPSGIILRCIIKRTSSFMNIISPEYDLYLANGLQHIMSAKKYPMRNRELFKFSTDPVKFTEPHLLSIMHANVHHNIYWLLDQPKRIGEFDLSIVELVIGYYRLKENQTHRKVTALLPSMNTTYQLAIDYEQNYINFSTFKEEVKIQLGNLQEWEDENNNSSKNFVLADEDDPQYRYLQMKKESDNIFELIIQHPLSPLQAMAMAMTRFDAQLK